MTVAPEILQELPAGFEDLGVEQAVRILLRTVLGQHTNYHELRLRHGELVRWIETDE